MTLQIYTNLHHFQFKSQKASSEGLPAFSWTSPPIFTRFPPSIRVSPSDIGPSVYSRLSALRKPHIWEGGKFDAFSCVFWVFFWSGNLEFGGKSPRRQLELTLIGPSLPKSWIRPCMKTGCRVGTAVRENEISEFSRNPRSLKHTLSGRYGIN